jgi:hypothetical protein
MCTFISIGVKITNDALGNLPAVFPMTRTLIKALIVLNKMRGKKERERRKVEKRERERQKEDICSFSIVAQPM